MATYFPKINQFRFHHGSFYSVSEKNMDNQNPDTKYLEGVYPQRFYQPILKTWPAPVGDTNEIDFVIHSNQATWAAEKMDCIIYKILSFDRLGNIDEIGSLGANATDWYLPSRYELLAMYNTLHMIGKGGFTNADYWSSTESSPTTAGAINFGTGAYSGPLKSASNRIRPIRHFAGAWGAYDFGDIGPSGGYICAHDGTNYYEAYWTDLASAAWSNITADAIGTTLAVIGEGVNNTDEIIAQAGHTASAAKNCYDLSSAGATATATAEKLTPADFYTYTSGRHVYRFTKSLGSYENGYYFIRLIGDSTNPYVGAVFYESNVFEINTVFDGSYGFVATNFENDFGNIWINATPTTWYLKLVVPYNMYIPKTKIEKEVYATDSGALTTLRSTINRIYELETMPIPMWFAELIQMATALSTIYVNDMTANFEDTPEIEPIQQSNLCILKGSCVLTGFNDYYLSAI